MASSTRKTNGNGGNGEAKTKTNGNGEKAAATTDKEATVATAIETTKPTKPARKRAAAKPAPKPEPSGDGFTWPNGGAQKVLVRYLGERVSDTFDAEHPARPYINSNGKLFVHSTDWREWLTDQGLAPSKAEAAKPLRELDMSVRATPLPGLDRALGFYIGDAPKGTEKLPRRVTQRSERAPRTPFGRLTDDQRAVVIAALTAYKPTKANAAHGDVRDELLAQLPA